MARGDETGPLDPRSLLNAAVAALTRAGVGTARLDAELILARAAGVARTQVIIGDLALDDPARRTFATLLARRVAREPLAYILGSKEFYSLELEVTPAVLIPRPETETLVAAALDYLATRPTAEVLDIGTGSGAIALALAAHAPAAKICAIDIADDALTIARRNAARLGLSQRLTLRRADCFAIRDGGAPLGRFDLVVANPPYIVDAEIATLQPEVARFEPRRALAGGADGLDFYRRIAAAWPAHSGAGGRLMVEIGATQAAAVSAILHAAGATVSARLRDPAGCVRVLVAGR